MTDYPNKLIKNFPNKFYKGVKKSNDFSYNFLIRLEDESNHPKREYTITNVSKDKYNISTASYNKNGDLIDLPIVKNGWKKISLSLNLIHLNDVKDALEHKFYSKNLSLEERNKLFRKNIEIYINGVKTDNTLTFMTLFNTDADIYIKNDYFTDEVANVINIVTFECTNKYIRGSFKSTVNKTPSYITINSPVKNINLSNNKGKYLFYLDGILLYNNEYEVNVTSNNTFEFKLLIDVNKEYNVDFTYDENIVYRVEKPIKTPFIGVNDNFLEDLPISIDCIDVYNLGERLPPDSTLRVVNCRCFELHNFKISTTEPNFISFIISLDPKTIKNTPSEYFYTDDAYWFIKWRKKDWGVEDTVDYKNTHRFVMNNDMKYPPKYISYLDHMNVEEEFNKYLHDNVLEQIKVNSYSCRHFLEGFTVKDREKINVEDYTKLIWDANKDNDEFITISFDKPHVCLIKDISYDKFDTLIFVNGIKVPKCDITYRNILENRVYIFIPTSYFINKRFPDSKKAIIEVEVIPIHNSTPKYYLEILDANDISNYLIIPKQRLGNVRFSDDIFIYKKVDEGYKLLVKDEDYKVVDDNNTRYAIHFINDSVRLNDILCIKNDSYFYYKEELLDVSNNIVNYNFIEMDLYDHTLDTKIPNSTDYSTVLFYNGIRLIEGIHYIYNNINKNKELRRNRIIFKFMPKKNSKVEVYIYEKESLQLFRQLNVKTVHGIIFLGKSEAPYSPEYMDVYLGLRKVEPKDIIMISDRIIMINPYIYADMLKHVAVYSKFNFKTKYFDPYTKFYKDNISDWENYLLEKYWIPDKSIDDKYDKKIKKENPLIDKLFEESKNYDKELDKDPFPNIPKPYKPDNEDDEIVDDIFDPLLVYIVTLKRLGELHRLLDFNTYTNKYNRQDLYELMEDPNIKVIGLNANVKLSRLANGNLNAHEWLLSFNERFEKFFNYLKDNNLPLNFVEWTKEKYESTELVNYLYWEELCSLFNCNNQLSNYAKSNIKEVIALNANY